jgi:hypothetical protein
MPYKNNTVIPMFFRDKLATLKIRQMDEEAGIVG